VETYEEKAEAFFKEAEEIDSCFSVLRVTPQTPPYHCEGPFVVDGILRAIAGLYAVVDGARLRSIEAFARERHFNEEILGIEDTMREHIASLTVYLLVHDLAKPNVLNLDAPKGSKGEAEGFAQHDYRASPTATEEERALFGKLLKSFTVSRSTEEKKVVTADFFDRYEIHAHYPGHGKQALVEHREVFERLCDHFRLTPRDRALVEFVVRNHMDAIAPFGKGVDARAYELLMSRAHKAGFDADDAIDFFLSAVFLDACVGSLQYKNGEFSSDVDRSVADC
jgi:hypothetical protein